MLDMYLSVVFVILGFIVGCVFILYILKENIKITFKKKEKKKKRKLSNCITDRGNDDLTERTMDYYSEDEASKMIEQRRQEQTTAYDYTSEKG